MSPYRQYRLYEMIPGALTWLTFIFAIVFSYWQPLFMIYFIIAYDLFWLLRIIYFITFLFLSWRNFRHDEKIDWREQLVHLPNWNKVYHLIFLPTYHDDISILRTSFDALVRSNYPLDQFIVVLAGEEKDKEHFLEISEKIRQEYAHYFFQFLITLHPKDVPGEMAGKGSNIHYAAEEARKFVDKLQIPEEKIIVSAFDIDTCVHPQYFSYLTFKFLTHPDPYHTSFQPIALYNNNFWQSRSFTRVVANSTTFWLLADLSRPERLFTFSSHSMSYKALLDVGFWQNDIVTEDSRIFLQCFIHYDGQYTVTPMYIPVSMDTVSGYSFWQTVKNQYFQIRRWAWGVEHFPFMLWHFPKAKKISWRKKFHYLFNLSEGMYSWATAPILIFILGRLPLFFADAATKELVIAQNLPFILSWLLRLAMVGMGISAFLNIFLVPSEARKKPFWLFKVFLQWIMLPITLILFGSIPAIEAQTRLMLGKYLGFNVTRKVREKASPLADVPAKS